MVSKKHLPPVTQVMVNKILIQRRKGVPNVADVMSEVWI
jgi:hypothetical protein